MSVAFPPIELAVREMIEELYPESEGNIGGDLSYVSGDDFYIFVALVSGATDALEGQWAVDIDVFSGNYLDAMSRALALEALLIRSRVTTDVMKIDRCVQITAPGEIPWDDEDSFRISATYMFTARRSG